MSRPIETITKDRASVIKYINHIRHSTGRIFYYSRDVDNGNGMAFGPRVCAAMDEELQGRLAELNEELKDAVSGL